MRRLTVAFAALALVLTLGRAGVRAQTSGPVIRIAATPFDNYAQAYYAQELGLFAKAGLNVEVQSLASGAAIASAVAGGAVDVGVATPVSLANAVSRGVPFTIIAAGALTNVRVPSGLVCVQASSSIRGPKDFEGKTIAIPALGTAGDLAIRAWLAQAGVDPAKVRIIEAPFTSMGPGVERGTYDGAEISEPVLSSALVQNNLRSVGDPFLAISREMLISGWFANSAFVQKNPDVVKKLAAALYEAGRWGNTHHDESALMLAKLTKIDVAVIRGMTRSIYVDALRASDLQGQLDVAFKFGFLNRPVAASELIGR